MFATTHDNTLTLPVPAGGVKNQIPVFMSRFLAVVPQKDEPFVEGKTFAGVVSGIETVVDVTGIAANADAYQQVCVKNDGTVVLGNPSATQAKLGVTKFAIDAKAGNTDPAAPIVATQRVKIIVQGI